MEVPELYRAINARCTYVCIQKSTKQDSSELSNDSYLEKNWEKELGNKPDLYEIRIWKMTI